MLRSRSILVPIALGAVGCSSVLGLGGDPDLMTGTDVVGPKVTVVISGTGRGRVLSTPRGIDCPGACTASFAAGSHVSLEVIQNGGTAWNGWQGDCSGPRFCDLVVDRDHSVTASISDLSGGHNFVFASEPHAPGTFGSLAAADQWCMLSAAHAGLPGTYVAWLSTMATSAKAHVGSDARGWVRTDGLPVADTMDDLLTGRMLMPISLGADGRPINAFPVTGTTPTGMVDQDSNCSDFTNPAAVHSAGDFKGTGSDWTSIALFTAVPLPCNREDPIYCFGIDQTAPLTVAPPSGRLAFLSQRTWNIGGGVVAADQICQSEADAAGKRGTFHALLATSTAPAATRLDDGPPWFRADGVPITATGGDSPIGADLLAPLNLTLSGSYLSPDPVAV